MELHTYAKRRVTKWSTVQKRRLVEARIANDALFSKMPHTCVAPWKKVVSLAKLDDYSVFFVRKQWSSMIDKYKQYKQSRLDKMPNNVMDMETVREITHEWEFFEPIHRFMTRKSNNLHSYALPLQERKTSVYPKRIQSPTHQGNSLTDYSDTNSPINDTNFQTNTNTDHDFYTKKYTGQNLSYYADISEDTQETVVMEEEKKSADVNRTESEPERLLVASEQIVEMKAEPTLPIHATNGTARRHLDFQSFIRKPDGAGTTAKGQNSSNKTTEKMLSERDKYYRHKRRFNRRLELRFDSILNVFGQIVKAEYPNIDVSPVLSGAATLANQLFSSDDDSAEEQNASSMDEREQLPNAKKMRSEKNIDEVRADVKDS